MMTSAKLSRRARYEADLAPSAEPARLGPSSDLCALLSWKLTWPTDALQEERHKSLATDCTTHLFKPMTEKALLAAIIHHAHASKDQAT